MASRGNPASIPWPLSSFPGANPQESSGRLINCSAEPLGDPSASQPSSPAPQVWRRQPGLSLFAVTAEVATYRGGMLVGNLSYNAWANVYTVTSAGVVTSLGALPGTKKISIAHNQVKPNPDVVAVDIDNGAYILNTTTLANATATATIGGSVFVPGDTVSLSVNNSSSIGFPVTVTYTLGSSETATTIAAGLKNLVNANAAFAAAGLTATSVGPIVTISQQGNVGNSTTLLALITPIGLNTGLTASVTGTGNETVTIVGGTGSATATVGGSVFTAGDTVSLTFTNPLNPAFPVKITYTLGAGSSAIIIANNLVSLINANAILTAAGISASNGGTAVVTILQPIGNETVVFSSTALSGGAGNPGIIFTGAPLVYNGLGGMPQPNSVSFQDGYFFYTIGDGRVFASSLNSVGAINGLTFVTIQAKSDVSLLRGIAFSGMMWFFTTGDCEIWQDAGIAAPSFPYSRLSVLEYGLLQANAIAGWDTGFSVLCWVAQDYGVYMAMPGQFQPSKISPPDLDGLIEAAARAGVTLEASCYVFKGKKFWVLSSPTWSWEFNVGTQKWNERWSINLLGNYSRWRATSSHLAFNKWLVGDEQSGNLLWVDVGNYTEHGVAMLFRMESGPVAAFPSRIRLSRADFQFDTGVGQATAAIATGVTGAAAGAGGAIVLAVVDTAQMTTNDTGIVVGVIGTTEANGTWQMTVIDATHVLLQGSIFVHAWISGGTLTDVTSPPNAINPVVAVSVSLDGGNHWGNPYIRYLGPQAQTKYPRISTKSMGLSGPMGPRFRIDVTDQVYVGFLAAGLSADPRVPGV